MKAYELLADPKAWTKDAEARGKDGGPVPPSHTGAVRWCLLGAIEKCYGFGVGPLEKVRDALRERTGKGLITFWNDAPERTHAEVVELLKELDV